MTEQEKVIWKVEILKQSEDMDDFIDEKIRQIQEERFKNNQVITSTKETIAFYEDAVDRIGKKGRRDPELKKAISDSELTPSKKSILMRDTRNMRKKIPVVETVDVDKKTTQRAKLG